MRLSSTDMKDRNMLFAAIPSICASSPKKISIYNEEMIVARCFIGFLIFSRKSLGAGVPPILRMDNPASTEESRTTPGFDDESEASCTPVLEDSMSVGGATP